MKVNIKSKKKKQKKIGKKKKVGKKMKKKTCGKTQKYRLQKVENWKNWKIEKIEFFCACCVHTQNFLWDNSLMLCCSPKNFSWFFDKFLIFKNLVKKIFFRKKSWPAEISKKKKKNEKSKNPADRPESAKYFWFFFFFF